MPVCLFPPLHNAMVVVVVMDSRLRHCSCRALGGREEGSRYVCPSLLLY